MEVLAKKSKNIKFIHGDYVKIKDILFMGYGGGGFSFEDPQFNEFSKKFDVGIDLLDGIKTDTGEMKGTLNKINETLGDFVTEQRAQNQRLEKILEKLAER